MPEGMTDETPDLYAVAVCVTKKTGADIDVKFGASAVVALSREDAVKQAMTVLLEDYPKSEGWRKHAVSVAVLERDFIRESLLEIDSFGIDEAGDVDEVLM